MTLTRAERRARTEQRILEAARALFAEKGFERTTIRAVAAAVGIDPALVMQHFGTKQSLFERAVRVGTEDAGRLVDDLLGSLGVKLGELPQSSLATMRSMLTHPEAAASARATFSRQIEQIGAAIEGRDARLKAALITLILLGVTVGHQLLDLDELRDVPAEEVARLLRPALQALT